MTPLSRDAIMHFIKIHDGPVYRYSEAFVAGVLQLSPDDFSKVMDYDPCLFDMCVEERWFTHRYHIKAAHYGEQGCFCNHFTRDEVVKWNVAIAMKCHGAINDPSLSAVSVDNHISGWMRIGDPDLTDYEYNALKREFHTDVFIKALAAGPAWAWHSL